MPPELRVPGPGWARFATDVVALAGVASFATAFWWDGVVVALFALVLLGLTVARLTQLPGALQAATGATLILSAWAATLDWFVTVPGLDIVAHVAANGLLAVVLMVVLWRTRLVPPGLPAVGVVVVTAALGALLAVLWETGEWFGHTVITDAIGVGYDDTIGDLAAGTLGSVAGGALLAMGLAREGELHG